MFGECLFNEMDADVAQQVHRLLIVFTKQKAADSESSLFFVDARYRI